MEGNWKLTRITKSTFLRKATQSTPSIWRHIDFYCCHFTTRWELFSLPIKAWDWGFFFLPGISSIRSNLISMKIAIFSLTLFAFLIFQFYSGSITSSILQMKPNSIKTLSDLIESPLHLSVEDIIYNKDFFNVHQDQGFAFMWSCKALIYFIKRPPVVTHS